MREQLHGPDFPHVWQVIENGLRIDLIPKQHSRFVEVNSPPRQKTVLGYWREAFDAPAAELQSDSWKGFIESTSPSPRSLARRWNLTIGPG